MPIPFRPRRTAARESLKQFKEGFEDPTLDKYELQTRWAVLYGPVEAARAYGGEFLHQLALRCHRRGEMHRAETLYLQSMQQLQGNPLGTARTMRDYAVLVAETKDGKVGLMYADLALQLHGMDIDNDKGRRQRLLTQSYVWRVAMIANREPEKARHQLVKLALGPDFTFHVRDQKVIVDFLIPRTKGKTRRQLLAIQSGIHRELHHPMKFIESEIRLIIDIELSIASTITRKLFRRE